MKLTEEQIRIATDNLGFSVIGQDHQSQPKLEEAFGEHTFFINDSGLFVFAAQDEKKEDPKTARLFVVAAWSDDDQQQLSPLKKPSEVDVVFDLTDGAIMSGNN